MNLKNIKELKRTIQTSDSAKKKLLNDPEKFIEDLQETPPIWNKKVFLTVVYIVGSALLVSLVFAGFSIFPVEYNIIDGKKEIIDKDVNNFFVMIASASIGALAGLLAPSPNEES